MTSIGIEIQLLSQADIDKGVDVTFPMNSNNISVRSVVPHSTISKQTFEVVELHNATNILYYRDVSWASDIYIFG